VGFGGMGGVGAAPQSGMDMQAFGRGFSAVTRIDTIVAHASPWFCLTTGAIAGVLLWSIPAALFLLNSVITYVSLGRPADVSALGRLGPSLPTYIAATAAIGLLLALLRRISAKSKRYLTVGNMTMSLNTLAATVGGLLIAVGLVATGSRAGFFVWLLGIGAPLVGFILDGIWQMFHDLLVGRLGKPDMEVLLATEADNFLARHPGIHGFVVRAIAVRGRVATVRGEWDDKEARERVHQALLCIEGIDRVDFERLS